MHGLRFVGSDSLTISFSWQTGGKSVKPALESSSDEAIKNVERVLTEDEAPKPASINGSAASTETTVSITVVGASGDLAKKKIFPALFALYYEGCLPKVCEMIHLQIIF